MITIISKIELGDNNTLILTDVGYTTDVNIISDINQSYDNTLGIFIAQNRTKLELGETFISSFFVDIDYINEARIQVDTIEGLDLIEIININQL
jgi:hypothetical protein|tara:strand:- start:138 stop:419 length:282 start_codon:yes stop_codon:yes gene_type:complete